MYHAKSSIMQYKMAKMRSNPKASRKLQEIPRIFMNSVPSNRSSGKSVKGNQLPRGETVTNYLSRQTPENLFCNTELNYTLNPMIGSMPLNEPSRAGAPWGT